MNSSTKITCFFSGGLELIFNKKKQLEVEVPEASISIKNLCLVLKNHITEKVEFFLTKEDEVRPGIIVLVGDTDWEILEKENTELKNNDQISFISTLHGG